MAAGSDYFKVVDRELAQSQTVDSRRADILNAQRNIRNPPRSGGECGVISHCSTYNNGSFPRLNNLFESEVVYGRFECCIGRDWDSHTGCLSVERWLAVWKTPSSASEVKNTDGSQSGCLAIVLPCEAKAYVGNIRPPQVTYVEVCVSYIRPQLSLGGFVSTLDQFFGSAPEQTSCYSENDREEGDDTLAVLMKPFAATPPNDFIESQETADVFLKGAAAFVILMLVHAGLKRW
jgi:hypothetical protein